MKRITLFCLAVLLLPVAGCDSTGDSDEAPPPIPSEAFALELGFFNQGATKAAAGTHFLAAALRVLPVSAIVGVHLIMPAAVTAAALQAEPERNGSTWTWTSTASVDQRTVSFALSGTVDGPDILWSMRISYSDGLVSITDFELFTAISDLDSRTGSWRLNYLVQGESKEVLIADYAVSDDGENVSVTYTIPDSFEQHAGDSVRFEHDGDMREFEWNQVAEQLNHLVVWNAATQVGSITATNFNGGEKACWDASLDNMTCLLESGAR